MRILSCDYCERTVETAGEIPNGWEVTENSEPKIVNCPNCRGKKKSKIYFLQKSPNYVSIMRDGKLIGQIYSQLKDGTTPYPHDNHEYCLNAIQICGFDKISEVWGCGPFHGKKDVVIHFIPETEYIEAQKRQYKTYVENKLNKGEVDTIQNFQDWNAHN